MVIIVNVHAIRRPIAYFSHLFLQDDEGHLIRLRIPCDEVEDQTCGISRNGKG